MGKKSAATAISKISSATAPAKSSTTNDSSKTSILKSSFAPSFLQLHLFASVIQSFDSELLRVHDTNSGRLRQQHAARSGTTITSLDWGNYSGAQQENGQTGNRKKRKRVQNATEDIVIAYGTSDSEVCMYSPAEGRVVGNLTGVHERGVRDFKFSRYNSLEGWSIGEDGKLVQWDLSTSQATKSISLPDPAISTLLAPSTQLSPLLCASTTPYAIYPSEEFRIESFDSFKSTVHSLQSSHGSSSPSSNFFLASDNDRFINVFDTTERKLVRTLITSSEAERLDLFTGSGSEAPSEEQVLAVVTRDGIIELFSQPFKTPTAVNGDLKSKRKSMTRKADAQVKLVDDNRAHANVFTASLQGPELIIASAEAGVDLVFQKIRWQDEGSGELLFEGSKEVVRNTRPSTFNTAQLNGVKDMGKTHVDESRAVVVSGTDDIETHEAVIEISSAEEEDAESGGESEPEQPTAKDEEAGTDSEAEMAQGEALDGITAAEPNEDVVMGNAEEQEPSFGELLASKHPKTVTIADSFAQEKSTFDVNKQLALPSGMSLGTVLTQALRTNDRNLLESCLHADDVGIIQNTIQRLDSALAATLLSKLAERLASRPGRYGHLLSWVQWTCIAHGGAIAGQSDVAAKIRSLYRVLSQRSKSLDKLLLLKGKLDMLDAQLTLRKQIQAQRGAHNQDQGEPGMIYIEGEEDNWSSDEEVDGATNVKKNGKALKQHRRMLEGLVDDGIASEDEDDGGMPMMNGFGAQDSDEEGSDEETAVTGRTRNGLYDVEADVSGEEDNSDEEDGEDEESSIDEGEEEEDEDDTSMDGFINDGDISYASDEEDIDLDDEPEVRKPEKKRSKHR